MARNNTRISRKSHTPRRRRKMSVLPYVIMAILILGIVITAYYFLNFNVNKSVEKLEDAIKTYDVSYLEENTDRLPIILDVLRKSYSEDSVKQEEFYDSNFSNLDLEVIDVTNKSKGKEVRLNVKNVNYIDVYDGVEENEDETVVHNNYVKALLNPDQDRSMMEATIFLERTIKGYRVYETREFINAILGGALEYADNNQNVDPVDGALDEEGTSQGN